MSDVLKFIRQEKPPSSCLLAGEETQLIEEARSSIARHFSADNRRTINLDKISGEDEMCYKNKSLFSSAAELFQLSSNGKPSAEGLAYIADMRQYLQAPDCMVVIISEWDYKYKKSAWYKKISEQVAETVLCENLPPAKAGVWIKHWAAEWQVELSQEVLQFLAIQSKGSLFAAKQAITKLALAGGAKQYDVPAVRKVLADGARYDIWDLSDAIYAGTPARALNILQSLRADDTAETLIQWSIVNLLNNIAAAKSGGSVVAWGKQLAAVRELSARISLPMLHRFIRQAAYADRIIKGVDSGDSDNILGGIVARLAAQAGNIKITLPIYQHIG